MNARILVVDDSVTIQKIVAMAFENEDVSVKGMSNGKEAFAQLGEVRPTVVLADTDMPGLTGYELSKKIKGSPESSGIKVILLTSEFEDFDEAEFRQSQADGYLSKPFKSQDIVNKIERLLEGGPAGEPAAPIGGPAQEAKDAGEIVTPPEENILEDPASLTGASPHAESGPADTAVKLSLEDILEEPEDEPADELNLSVEDILEEADLSAETENPESAGSGESRENAVPEDPLEKDIAEVNEGARDSVEDLEQAFQELKAFEEIPDPGQTPVASESSGKSGPDDVEPVAENILEEMAPSAFSSADSPQPDLIRESLSFISDRTSGAAPGEKEDLPPVTELKKFTQSLDRLEGNFSEIVREHINELLEKSLNRAVEKELAGLSDVIRQSVEEAVRETIPIIARDIIREEIKKIRDMEQV